MAGAGGSLVYQHVYGSAVPLLSHLIGTGASMPSLAEVADFVGRVTTTYVRSLGQRRMDAMRVSVLIGGQLPNSPPEAYKLSPTLGDDGLVEFPPVPLDLVRGRAHFIGDHLKAADALLADVVARDQPGAPRERAVLSVIRRLINDPEVQTIGGEVQIGFTTPIGGFRRVASVVPDRGNEPRALRLLNSIDVDGLGAVGPCAVGMDGMVAP